MATAMPEYYRVKNFLNRQQAVVANDISLLDKAMDTYKEALNNKFALEGTELDPDLPDYYNTIDKLAHDTRYEDTKKAILAIRSELAAVMKK